MGRKRLAKKRAKRRSARVEWLEDLYLRREDEAFLEAAHSGGSRSELVSGPVAELYRDVVDRSLARALEGGDLEGLERLLGLVLQGPCRGRRVALAAAGVVDLARGRLEPARAVLATLAVDGESGEDPDPLAAPVLEGLRALCGDEPSPDAGLLPEPLRRELADFQRVTRRLTEPLPGRRTSSRRAHPAAKAAEGFHRALAGLRRKGPRRPGPRAFEKLGEAVDAVAAELPDDGDLAVLQRTVRERVDKAPALIALERKLRQRARPGARLDGFLLAQVESAGLSREHLGGGPSPAVLGPLDLTLRERWRGLLTLVAEHDGDRALAALYATWPELFGGELEVSEDDGGPRALKLRVAATGFLQAGRHHRLGGFLSRFEGEAVTAARRATAWSLELRVRFAHAESCREEEEEEEEHTEGGFHSILERLGGMAEKIERHFEGEERPQVARHLRGKLFELCQELCFCGHFHRAGMRLLRHLPGDPGLLTVALAGAVANEDAAARRRVESLISTRGASGGDPATLLPLLRTVVVERPSEAVRTFEGVRPLFTEDFWRQAAEAISEEFSVALGDALQRSCLFSSFSGSGINWAVQEADDDLRLYLTLLGDLPVLMSWRAILDGCRQGSEQATAFLARFTDLEPALCLGRQLLHARGLHPSVDEALEIVAGAVTKRLDSEWRRWHRLVPRLASFATRRQVKALKKKIKRLRKDPALDPDGRERLGVVLEKIDYAPLLAALGDDLEMLEIEPSPEPPRRPRRRKPARRGGEADPKQLVLPGLT